MLSRYLHKILEAVENVLVGPGKRLRPEIQIFGDIYIELLVKGKVADRGADKEEREQV